MLIYNSINFEICLEYYDFPMQIQVKSEAVIQVKSEAVIQATTSDINYLLFIYAYILSKFNKSTTIIK
jgi:hypothetical protein